MLFKRTGLSAVYTTHAIQSFAFSLVGLFVPIYLLSLNYSLWEVFLFFIIYYIACGLGAFVAIAVAKRIGLIHTINVRFPLLVIFLAGLYLLKNYDLNIYVLAVIGGLQNILYWIPFHLLFTRNATNKNIGSSTGVLFALPKVINLAAPILGGLIATYAGFGNLILTSLVIFLISTLPLMRAGNITADFVFKFKSGWQMIKKYPRYYLAEIFENFGEESEAIIWPVFIYLNFISIVIIGATRTISKIGSILFSALLGKAADQVKNIKWLFKIGAVCLCLLWLTRYFFFNDSVLYGSTLLIGFFMLMLLVPYTAILYKTAQKETTDEFFVFREIPIMVSRVIILSVAMIFYQHLEFSFAVAGLSYLYFLFI